MLAGLGESMTQPDETFRREDLKRGMRDGLERSLEDRVERYLEVAHQGIIPNHHFAAASSECIDLYRDGYFWSAVMVSQSVTEGIWRFVLERNQVQSDRDREAQAATLVQQGILSPECADNFGRIWRSFRNDVHHMNPGVSAVPIRDLAKRNLIDLAAIEREIFAVTFDVGLLIPIQPRYWDVPPNGTISVFLRKPWIAG
jgi:hypothetical protein